MTGRRHRGDPRSRGIDLSITASYLGAEERNDPYDSDPYADILTTGRRRCSPSTAYLGYEAPRSSLSALSRAAGRQGRDRW